VVYFGRIVVDPVADYPLGGASKKTPARGIRSFNRGSAAKKVEEILPMKKLLVVCLALCVMFMLVGVTFAADTTTVNGIVSDSKCGAKNAGEKGAECTKECVKKGAKLVVVTDADQKVVAVDNPDVLTGHEGHHVAVTGTMTGDSMHVDSVKMLAKSGM
jgi:hypothetical protein